MTDKYVVFKISDWLDQREVINRVSNTTNAEDGRVLDGALSALDRARLDDAVVIRRQDLFAAPALHTYAAMMAIAVRLSKASPERDRLHEIADYFHEQAVLADDEGRRIPD